MGRAETTGRGLKRVSIGDPDWWKMITGYVTWPTEGIRTTDERRLYVLCGFEFSIRTRKG